MEKSKNFHNPCQENPKMDKYFCPKSKISLSNYKNKKIQARLT